ncbi:hypothetical protein JCM10296v2_000967 [Rhodotorula toruloides]
MSLHALLDTGALQEERHRRTAATEHIPVTEASPNGYQHYDASGLVIEGGLNTAPEPIVLRAPGISIHVVQIRASGGWPRRFVLERFLPVSGGEKKGHKTDIRETSGPRLVQSYIRGEHKYNWPTDEAETIAKAGLQDRPHALTINLRPPHVPFDLTATIEQLGRPLEATYVWPPHPVVAFRIHLLRHNPAVPQASIRLDLTTPSTEAEGAAGPAAERSLSKGFVVGSRRKGQMGPAVFGWQ